MKYSIIVQNTLSFVLRRPFLTLLLGATLSLLVLQSCSKEPGGGIVDTDTVSAEDNSTAESMFDDVFAVMDEAAQNEPGIRSGGYRASCAQVSVDTASS